MSIHLQVLAESPKAELQLGKERPHLYLPTAHLPFHAVHLAKRCIWPGTFSPMNSGSYHPMGTNSFAKMGLDFAWIYF